MAIPFLVAAGAAVQGVGSIGNIIGGINARKEEKRATRVAEERLLSAEKRIGKVETEALQVPLEAYGLQMQGIMGAQASGLQATREAGQRAVLGGVQRIQEGTTQAIEKTVRQPIAEKLYNRDATIIREKLSDADKLAGIDLEVAKGAQIRAKEQKELAGKLISSGIQGLGSAANTLYKGSDLYSQRQGELAGGERAMEDMALGEGVTNARQARRSMLDMGYTKDQIARYGAGEEIGIPSFLNPMGLTGIEGLSTTAFNNI